MDRSFLSDAQVVRASRSFVCARLSTYEDAAEAAFLTTVFPGRSGQLENSVFALMDPSGQKVLGRAGRSPSFAFRDAAEMAKEMDRIAQTYPGKEGFEEEKLGLPRIANLRLALNVAACDDQRLVVVRADDAKQAERLEAALAPLIWDAEVVGRFLYVVADGETSLDAIADAPEGEGVLIVEPNAFGTEAKLVSFVPAGGDQAQAAKVLARALRAAAEREGRGSVDAARHRREGRRAGIEWETQVPVTDPHEREARRRR